jgi:hypothetical protein
LSQSPWDGKLLNRNRINLMEYHLCFLAYNFLEFFRVTQVVLSPDTIDDTICHLKNDAAKGLVLFIYKQAQNNVPLENIYQHL